MVHAAQFKPPAQPEVGPVVYSVRDFQNRTILAAGGSVGPVVFRWPRPVFVTGIQLIPQSGDPIDSAAFSIRVQDETQDELFSDGQGFRRTVPELALGGLNAFRPFVLQRPVAAGDLWLFTVTNDTAGNKIVAALLLYFSQPGTRNAQPPWLSSYLGPR